MTALDGLFHCPGNGDEPCQECRRRAAAPCPQDFITPPPPGKECTLRVVPLDVLVREQQGRGD